MSGDRYFAFLRAINTGARRLTNEQLLAPFHQLGFTDVAAYQAAGNVTFRCDDVDGAAGARIEATLAAAYGFETPTFIRTGAQVSEIAAAQPFGASDVAASAGKMQVTFLRKPPSEAAIEEALSLVPADDRIRVIGTEWYWLPVEGVSTSKLPVSMIEGVFGAMTMRTLGTVERISAKFAD